MNRNMNELGWTGLKYDRIKNVIRATPMSIPAYPNATNKLSHARISSLIKESPFYKASELNNMQSCMAHGMEVMMGFLKQVPVTAQSTRERSDMSSLTVNIE